MCLIQKIFAIKNKKQKYKKKKKSDVTLGEHGVVLYRVSWNYSRQ